MPRKKDSQPELKPLADYVKSIFSQLQTKPWPFSQKYLEVAPKHSTIRDIIGGKTKAEPDTLWLLADAIAREMIEAKGRRLIDTALDQQTLYDQMMALLPKLSTPQPQRKLVENAPLNPIEVGNLFAYHFWRLDLPGQMEVTPKILATIGQAANRWRNGDKIEPDGPQPIERLRSDLLAGIGEQSIADWAADLLDKKRGFSRSHLDYAPLVAGLTQVVEDKTLPETGSDEFAVLSDYLNRYLGFDHEGDAVRFFESYGFFLGSEGEESSAPPASNTRSAK